MPVCALSVGTIAAYARYVRSSMVDNLNEQYVRTARAKGLSEFRVVFVHTLRNAMFPVITMIGLYIPAMFCGALVIETLFNFTAWATCTTRPPAGETTRSSWAWR